MASALLVGGLVFGFRHHGDRHRVGLGGLARRDHVDDLVALGDFDGLGGGDLFLGRNRQRARGLGDGLRLGLLLALGGDRDRAFLRDDLQVAFHFGVAALHREIGFDLSGVARLVGFGLLVGDRQFLLDAVFGFVLHRGLLDLRGLRAHRSGLVGDVALLRQFRLALGGFDGQRGLPGDEVLLGDVDLGGADDLVALLLAFPGDLGQRRQTVGVEEIARVEMLDVALVEPGQRHRFELEAVVLDVGADRFLHRLDEGRALLLQLFEVHGGGDRTKTVDEFRLDQLAQFAGIVGAAAQRLRGERDRRGIGFDAHVEFGADVDAHAVLGDQRIRAAARDFEPQRLQVDRGRRVENRQHERAAVEDDFLAAEAGADIGFVTGRTAVEFCKQETDNKNDNDANSDGYCKFPHVFKPCLIVVVQ